MKMTLSTKQAERGSIGATHGESPASQTMSLIAVVPAYNEAGRIAEVVRALQSMSPQFAERNLALRVYVVDDGSSDGTGELARQAGADRVIRHKINLGLGAAVRTGLAAARGESADIVIKFDGDLQHDPEDLVELVGPILRDEAEVVYGNRFPRIQYRMPFVRRVGNLIFTRLMGWLTGWPLKDSQPGVLAVHRAYLEKFHLPGDYNYTQQILLDAYHKGMRFAHVPVAFRKRESGRSFVSLKYPFKVLPQILMVLVGVKPLKVFGPIGLVFLIAGGVVFAWDFGQWLLGDSAKPAQHVNLILGASLFGLQTLFFGVIADLIVRQGRR